MAVIKGDIWPSDVFAVLKSGYLTAQQGEVWDLVPDSTNYSQPPRFAIHHLWYVLQGLKSPEESGAHLEMFSEPARSTRLSLPILMTSSPSALISLMCTRMQKTLWERLEPLFNSVAAVCATGFEAMIMVMSCGTRRVGMMAEYAFIVVSS